MERDRFKLSELNQYYSALLTQKQRSIFVLHYDNDMSLAEISEEYGITRQAVLDNLRRAEKSLEEYENLLGWVARDKQLSAHLVEAQNALSCGDAESAKRKVNAAIGVLEA